jgi:hypothetical protein
MNNKLYDRVYEDLVARRERLLSGKINCIPWGLSRFEEESPGIEQGKSYLASASSKIGKSQITNWLFVFNPIRQIIDEGLDIKLKIFYFSLEMTSGELMRSIFSNILYLKEGVRISPKELRSTKKGSEVSPEILKLITQYKPYFDKIEELVTFIDDIRHPTGINAVMESYAKETGTTYYKDISINGKTHSTFDYYVPNNPDEYVMCIIDHISLITPEKQQGKQLSLRESIGLLSSNYLVKLRNRYNYTPVVIQQQAASVESVEHSKARQNKPTLDGLGDNKTTQRDFNLILGLYSPFRYEVPKYYGYDITYFRDNIRFLEILGGREGGAGTVCPLYFDGAVNYFRELPLPDDNTGIKQVYRFIEKIRKK